MANTTRTPFLQHNDGAVLRFLVDSRYAPGNVFFVQSTHTNAGDSAGKGQGPDAPFATIDYAVGQCTAGNGDLILVLPGHVETVAAANGLDLDVAGITVVGLGNRGARPQINLTATASTVRINANNVHFEGFTFTGGIDAVVSALNVNGKTDVTLRDLEFRDVTGQATKWLHASNNSDRLTVEDVRVVGAAAAGATHAFTFDGCDDLVLRNFQIRGNYSTAAIGFITTASARVDIYNGRIWNQNSADVCIVDTVTGSTGNIGPGLYLMLTDNTTNITEAITGATFQLFDDIYVCNLAGEKAMLINWTASTDA